MELVAELQRALSYPFMQRAVMASVLVAVVVGLAGPLAVLNRLIFLAGGVAHAAVGGVGLAVFIGLPIAPVTLAFSGVVSAAVGYWTGDDAGGGSSKAGAGRADTLIGAAWAGGMAGGVVLADLAARMHGTPRPDFMAYLFGSIFTVSMVDVAMLAAVAVGICALRVLAARTLALTSLDPEFARSCGVRVRLWRTLTALACGLAVVAAGRVVGLVLVMALFTIPCALAEPRARSLMGMSLRAGWWALLFLLVGLALAWVLDITSGPAVLVAAAGFYALQTIYHRLQRRRTRHTP